MPGADSPRLVEHDERTTAVVAGVVPMDELADFFDRSFGALGAALAAQGVEPTGPAFGRYRGAPTDVADLEVGFPTAAVIDTAGDVVASTLPGGTVATVAHRGSFDGLGPAWGELFAWAATQGVAPTGDMWEVYVTEPSPDMDPDDLVTELFLAVRAT